MPVKRGPEPGPGEQGGDRILGPGPVEQVGLEREHEEVGMTVQQRS